MYLGLDLGTSSLKAVIVDRDSVAQWVGEEGYEVRMSSGRAQIAAGVWWDACVETMRTAPPELRGAIRAIGLSGQMHGVVLAGGRGEPLHDAILWPDRRATDHLGKFQLIASANPGVLGNPIVPGMPGPVMSWLQERDPELFTRTLVVLSPKDWLRSQITGESPIATDASDASASLMYDILADDWSSDVANALGLDPSVLPTIGDSCAVAGMVSAQAAEELGLVQGTPVAVGAGDAAAALLGMGIETPGRVLLNVGTAAQVITVVDRPEERFGELDLNQFRTAGAGSRWYIMAPIFNAGLALMWVGRVLGLKWEELYAHAGEALDGFGSDPRFVPFLTRERDPRVRPDAQASWTGLSTEHNKMSMARAALLGVAAYLTLRARAVLELAGADRVILSGGAVRNEEWTRLLATLIGVEVDLAPDSHASARGAAVTAARSLGEELEAPPIAGTAVPQPSVAAIADEVLDVFSGALLASG